MQFLLLYFVLPIAANITVYALMGMHERVLFCTAILWSAATGSADDNTLAASMTVISVSATMVEMMLLAWYAHGLKQDYPHRSLDTHPGFMSGAALTGCMFVGLMFWLNHTVEGAVAVQFHAQVWLNALVPVPLLTLTITSTHLLLRGLGMLNNARRRNAATA